jgi:HemY protein
MPMFRHVFWFLALAAVAVALALLVGQNHASVTVFWPPYRIDLSFNLVLFGVVALFVLLHLSWRGVASLAAMPGRARRWRARQLERAAVSGVMDALSNQLAGRFVRAQTAAQEALGHLQQLPDHDLPRHGQLTALAHLLLAESAHALQNRETRDQHQRLAIVPGLVRQGNETREGALLRAARWAVEDRDPTAAAAWLAELPQGAARRIVALRLRLRVARMQRDATAALEMARVLAKHRAYSSEAAPSVLRGLVLDAFKGARDLPQLQAIWRNLDVTEQAMPELAIAAAERLHALAAPQGQDMASADDAAHQARNVVLNVWPGYAALDAHWRARLVKVLARRMDVNDTGWLARIEQMQRQLPNDPFLQYLGGHVCLQRQLWGKAAQLLAQASTGLQDADLLRQTWCGLAQLAEERGDGTAAQTAWKRAAQIA